MHLLVCYLNYNMDGVTIKKGTLMLRAACKLPVRCTYTRIWKANRKELLKKSNKRDLLVTLIQEVYRYQCHAAQVQKSYLEPASQHVLPIHGVITLGIMVGVGLCRMPSETGPY